MIDTSTTTGLARLEPSATVRDQHLRSPSHHGPRTTGTTAPRRDDPADQQCAVAYASVPACGTE